MMEDNEKEENDDNYMSPEYGGNERGEAEHEEADPIIHDDLRGLSLMQIPKQKLHLRSLSWSAV